MAVIVFASPKGGVGKTTAAVLLGTELAQHGGSVTILDADPNEMVVKWASTGSSLPNISVMGSVDETNFHDKLEAATAKSAFVIVDLEGTASLMTSHVLSQADLVIIPVSASFLDAEQAQRQIQMIRRLERTLGRSIPFTILFSRASGAIRGGTQRMIEAALAGSNIPVLRTALLDREAYRLIFAYGGSVSGLAATGRKNLEPAIRNAAEFAGEVVGLLKQSEFRKAS